MRPLWIALLVGACSPDRQPPKRPTPAAASEGPTDEALAPQSQSSAAADPVPDPRVDEVIAYVQYGRDELTRRIRSASERAIKAGRMTRNQAGVLLRFYREGMDAYTYLTG